MSLHTHTYPCCVLSQVTSSVFNGVGMAKLLQKLHLLDNVLPFLETEREREIKPWQLIKNERASHTHPYLSWTRKTQSFLLLWLRNPHCTIRCHCLFGWQNIERLRFSARVHSLNSFNQFQPGIPILGMSTRCGGDTVQSWLSTLSHSCQLNWHGLSAVTLLNETTSCISWRMPGWFSAQHNIKQ